MRDRSEQSKLASTFVKEGVFADKPHHPAWRSFIRYCAELQHGEIGSLKIQDGLPVLAEVVTKKIKFAP